MIREYSQEDYKLLIELFRSNVPAYFDAEEEKDLIRFINEDREHFFVVEMDNALIACGGFALKPEVKAAYITWDMVHPNYQGKGIGTVLTEFRLQSIAMFPDVEKIIVRTSQKVSDFYARFGFKLKQTQKDYWAKGLDLHYMEIVLEQ